MPKITAPNHFICALTHKIMQEPVKASDGQVYEKEAIESWLEDHDSSPITKEPLDKNNLEVMSLLKEQIEAFKQANNICTKEAFLEAIKVGNVVELEKLNYLAGYVNCLISNTAPITLAVRQQHIHMIEFLLDNGANPNTTYLESYMMDYDGAGDPFYFSEEFADPPLLIATQHGNVNIVNLLLARGADPNGYGRDDSGDCNGWTALHYAAQLNQPKIAKLLLEKGADPNPIDWDEGLSPLHIANKNSHTEVANIIRMYKNAKTQLCRFFQEGKQNLCRQGAHCHFAHGQTELRSKK